MLFRFLLRLVLMLGEVIARTDIIDLKDALEFILLLVKAFNEFLKLIKNGYSIIRDFISDLKSSDDESSK